MKKEYFDTVELQLTYDICNLHQDLNELRAKVEIMAYVGNLTQADFHTYTKSVREINLLLLGLTTIPVVKFMRKYDYFRFPQCLNQLNQN